MLIIKSHHGEIQIDWDSVQSIHFDNRNFNSDALLKITTKSGVVHTVKNATDQMGKIVDFGVFSKAWLGSYNAWKIKESNSRKTTLTAH